MFTTREFALWAWLRLRLATPSPPHHEVEVVVGGGGEGGVSVASSVHCKQRHGIQTCPTPFLSCLLSCLLACKPPPPTTITTLDDVSSQQKRDVQHQIPKPGARVYLFCSVLLLLFFP